MQFLSKYFFTERDRKIVNEFSIIDFGDEEDRGNMDLAGNELGLTAPVYDFLQFLLRYNQRAEIAPRNKELLRFFRRLSDSVLNFLIDIPIEPIGSIGVITRNFDTNRIQAEFEKLDETIKEMEETQNRR